MWLHPACECDHRDVHDRMLESPIVILSLSELSTGCYPYELVGIATDCSLYYNCLWTDWLKHITWTATVTDSHTISEQVWQHRPTLKDKLLKRDSHLKGLNLRFTSIYVALGPAYCSSTETSPRLSVTITFTQYHSSVVVATTYTE